jgi:O-antigen/teichoic acid export membrane protein
MAIDLSELGINPSAIRYGAEYAAKEDWGNLSKLFSIVLRSRLAISLAVCLVGLLIADPLATFVFKTPEVTLHLYLAFGGLFGTLFNSAFIAILQANQQFDRAAVVTLVIGAGNTVGVTLLWVAGSLTSLSALVVYLITPLVGSAVAYFLLPRRLVSLRLWDKEIAHKLFSFGKWMAVWAIARVVQNRLDVFMLTNMTTTVDVGHYNAAYRIALLASLVPIAYSTVITPRFASSAGTPTLHVEFKRTLVISCLLAGLILIASFFAPLLIPFWLGEAYEPSMSVLRVLLWAWTFFSLNLAFGSVLYAIEKPSLIAITTCATLAQTFVTNSLLIPRYGAVGAAFSYLISQAIVLIAHFAAVWFFYLRKRQR